jgi:integrase
MHTEPADASPINQNLSLSVAARAYLSRREHHLKPRSQEAYRYHFRTLQRFFTPDKILSSFHEGDFREYQRWRIAAGAGTSLINHELGALAQVLDLADLWVPISRYYERLPDKDLGPPKVMNEEEEDRFFRFAAQKPEWKTAFNSARLTANSTIQGCELRMLRLENLRLNQQPPVVLVPETVKNKYRMRSVPLNVVALAAVRELAQQAKERGAHEPQHYLIPFRVKRGVYEPRIPASPCFVRAAFRSIARSCGLDWVTPRTFRHQAITKLLESGAPDETVRAIAGHVSEKAMRYYSHIRIEAKKTAVDRLAVDPQKPKVSKSSRSRGKFPLLNGLKETAERLGISTEAALEMVLFYEQSKASDR